MSAVTALICILLLLLPGYMLLSVRQKHTTIGSRGGYRSALSLSSKGAWQYAQRIMHLRYMLGGILMIVASLLFILCIPAKDVVTLVILGGIALGFQVVVMLFLMASIEISLQNYCRRAN
ncbi:MAG: SdpI family protein [Clostridia bacterium]|nr:SdpI family protein [Clostridia bacterium]